MLLYSYISRFSVDHHHQQQLHLRPSFIAFFSLSHKCLTLAFAPESGYTTRLSEKDRTQRLTRRNRGRFGWGRYYYPRTVSHVSETLRGRGLKRQTLPLLGLGWECSRRTQKAFGAAMRLCASLLRGVAAPLGCATLLLLLRSALKGSLQAVAESAENAYPPRTVRI